LELHAQDYTLSNLMNEEFSNGKSKNVGLPNLNASKGYQHRQTCSSIVVPNLKEYFAWI
jgi:hypothetical protein